MYPELSFNVTTILCAPGIVLCQETFLPNYTMFKFVGNKPPGIRFSWSFDPGWQKSIWTEFSFSTSSFFFYTSRDSLHQRICTFFAFYFIVCIYLCCTCVLVCVYIHLCVRVYVLRWDVNVRGPPLLLSTFPIFWDRVSQLEWLANKLQGIIHLYLLALGLQICCI